MLSKPASTTFSVDQFSSSLQGSHGFLLVSFLQGSVSLWDCGKTPSTWSSGLPLCGHSGPVTDLSWSRSAVAAQDSVICGSPLRVLLSAGADQTVRAHVPCRLRMTVGDPSDSGQFLIDVALFIPVLSATCLADRYFLLPGLDADGCQCCKT